MTNTFPMLAKTFKGLEPILAQELAEIGATDIRPERRAVAFTGTKEILYKANFCLRTASRVLVPIASFTAKDADEVYASVKNIDWSQYMTLATGFAIDTTVYSETFRHSKYVAYRVKDAIADYWTEREGKRPNVKLSDPDLQLNVHIAEQKVIVSLDSSGESLHKRGYRVANTEAPINEALAAGMLLMAGWHGQSDFYDPMCGSGTFLIEAALIAQNIAPGVFRNGFAFEKWNNFDADLFEQIYNDDSREKPFTHHIYGSDASFYAIRAAEQNVKAAGQQRFIALHQIRIQELNLQTANDLTVSPINGETLDGKGHNSLTTKSPLVIMNPPYGERLAQNKDILQLYREIGTALKHQFVGATAWILSSNEEALKCIGLKPSKRIHLLNGELDCLFNCYEMFSGKRNEQLRKTNDKRPKTNIHS